MDRIREQASWPTGYDALRKQLLDFEGSEERGQFQGSFTARAKDGGLVELSRYADIADHINLGWTIDLVEAYYNGEPAGFLKISYIPEDRFNRYFPDCLAYVVRLSGKYTELGHLISRPRSEWERDDFHEAIIKTDQWFLREADLASRSTREMKSIWAKRERAIIKDYQQEYLEFEKFQKNNPFIEQISVYKADEDMLYVGGKRRNMVAARDYARKGIGTLMYEVGAMWMAERGLRLHASSNQSKEAKEVWQRFEERGLVEKVGEGEGARRALVAYKMGEELTPEVAEVVSTNQGKEL